MAPVDESFANRTDCQYFRFVDDILILCANSDVDRLAGEVVNSLTSLGLTIYDFSTESKKSYTGSLASGFEYLGYRFIGERTTIRPSSVSRVEAALAREFTRYHKATGMLSAAEMATHRERSRWFINLAITGCIYKGAARGWLQYYRQMNDFTLLHRLDAAVGRFERRFGLANLQPKSFVKTYWALKHPKAHENYIPNFDKFAIQQMRDTLALFNVADAHVMPERLVKASFFRAINKAVTSLERDIGAIS